jgi:hypothetical protein
MWLGSSEWFGLNSNTVLEYVLPNINNFGCRLYLETDPYTNGTGTFLIYLHPFHYLFYFDSFCIMVPDPSET